jgi:hypothetical protein
VTEEISQRLEKLKDDLLAATDEVGVALESDEDRVQLAAGQSVESLAQRYNDLLDELEGDERDRVERSVGRRITDLRRSAAGLSRRDSGARTSLAVDAGQVPFLLQRQPGKSIVPQRHAPTRDTPRYSVGSEVESWCGKCKEMRTHNIVAMVGGEPKQVVCATCNSRHNFRTEPPARAVVASGEKPVTDGGHRRLTTVDPQTAKKQEERRTLQKELAEAVDPRPFDPKARYKAGEIILHPEHGRGKIENVLKGSLLVRFSEGLRPLNLS